MILTVQSQSIGTALQNNRQGIAYGNDRFIIVGKSTNQGLYPNRRHNMGINRIVTQLTVTGMAYTTVKKPPTVQ